MQFGVVIPTFNEAGFIGRTIDSLGRQVNHVGRPAEPGQLEVVVADTPGNDGTVDAATQAGSWHPALKVTVLSESEPSMVAARTTGFNYLLSRPGGAPDVLVSADADTTFPPTWLAGVETALGRGHRMVSTAGCFEHRFWLRCPTLARRYIDQVGTIFFNAETARAMTTEADTPMFTSELFRCFGRPVSDCGLAITPGLFRQLGGIRREYYDDERTRPILAVGWPLMFRAELTGEPIAYVPLPEYETSARRLLHEPEALFSGASYLDEIEHFRSTTEDQYAWLEYFADRLDMKPLQRYVVKNYVLQQCITRPDRVMANQEYFGEMASELVRTILAWRDRYPEPSTRDIFTFADHLADTYGDNVLNRAHWLAERGRNSDDRLRNHDPSA